MDDMIAAPSEGAPAEGESVLDCIMREGKGHPASNGGLVSPSGFSYIGSSAENLVPENADKNVKRLDRAPVIAIKRIHMDEKLAKAAEYAGAHLVEERSVENAVFDNVKKVWRVNTVKEDGSKEEETYTGRIVVCADGAPSRLAMKLGLVSSPPQGTCSRAFVEGKTHNFGADVRVKVVNFL
jgi:flavin-dependent dehydrogenase